MSADAPRFVVTTHAAAEMARRGLAADTTLAVLEAPEQTVPVRTGRVVYQSRVAFPPDGHTYLVRVIVDTRQETLEVVTAYRTSKLAKYWDERS